MNMELIISETRREHRAVTSRNFQLLVENWHKQQGLEREETQIYIHISQHIYTHTCENIPHMKG
jgi:hypothetical protein